MPYTAPEMGNRWTEQREFQAKTGVLKLGIVIPQGGLRLLRGGRKLSAFNPKPHFSSSIYNSTKYKKEVFNL